MRLLLLYPSLIYSEDGKRLYRVPRGSPANGLIFRCPRCTLLYGRDKAHCYLAWFANGINGAQKAGADWKPLPRWSRQGTLLDNYTMARTGTAKCWAGSISDGETVGD